MIYDGSDGCVSVVVVETGGDDGDLQIVFSLLTNAFLKLAVKYLSQCLQKRQEYRQSVRKLVLQYFRIVAYS